MLVVALPVACGAQVMRRVCWEAPEDSARSTAYSVAMAAETFARIERRAPASLEELRARYVHALPLDPWGRSFALVAPSRRSGTLVDIISAGADGQLFTEDDVGNWRSE